VSEAGIALGDPRVIVASYKIARGAFTAAGTFEFGEDLIDDIDLTDGAGHGVLVATDSIFIGAATTSYAGAATFYARVFYRFKEVTLQEYIGIVQSQQ
jgi:hypothetical protein